MKFMVEFQLEPGAKDQAFATFEQRGPNRHPGVTFLGAWIAKRNDIAYVLVDAQDEAFVAKVAESWANVGSAKIHPVVDVQQY